jgi:hypothetical protein
VRLGSWSCVVRKCDVVGEEGRGGERDDIASGLFGLW